PFTNHFFMGDTIIFRARDVSNGLYFSANISITGTPVAGPPVITFNIPVFDSFPGATNPVIFPAGGQPLWVLFNCLGTYSTELLPVVPSWYEGSNLVSYDALYGWFWEYPGLHTITLSASDGVLTSSASQTFEVLSAGSASAHLEDYLNQFAMAQKSARR